MKIIPYDLETKAGWKSYPVRIQGVGKSNCHNQPRLLVQSMEGGFVTQNCSACGQFNTLSDAEWRLLDLWVACPECRKRMRAGMVAKNYGFICPGCDIAITLASILPRWEDLI